MARNLVFAVVVAALLVALLWFPLRHRPRPRIPEATPAPVPAAPASGESRLNRGLASLRALGGVEMSGPSFRQTDQDGRPIFEVVGDKVINDDAKEIMRITGVRATMFQQGKPLARFVAQEVQVRYAEAKHRLTFVADVVITSELKQAELRAGRVEYEPATRRLTALDGIKFKQGPLSLQSAELHAELSLGTVKLIGPVSGTIAKS